MPRLPNLIRWVAALLSVCALDASAQSFKVQCPSSTILHPLVNVRGREVQITGHPVKVEQLERHKTRAL